MPESGNKYFTENLPSGTVIFVDLKVLCWQLLLVMTTLRKFPIVKGMILCSNFYVIETNLLSKNFYYLS